MLARSISSPSENSYYLCGSNLSAKMYKNIYLTYLKIWKNDFAETLAHKNIPLKMAYYPLHTPCQNIFFGTTQKVSEITPHWKWAIFLAFLKLKGNFSLLGLNSCEFWVMAAIFDNFGIFKSTHIVHTLVQVIVYTGLCSFFHAAAFVTLGHPIPFVSTTTTCRAHSELKAHKNYKFWHSSVFPGLVHIWLIFTYVHLCYQLTQAVDLCKYRLG